MSYFKNTSKDDDFVRVHESSIFAEGGDADADDHHGNEHPHAENALVAEGMDSSAMRDFDSMISLGDTEENEDDEDSRDDEQHSAIDGEGEETKAGWKFLTTQYQVPTSKERKLHDGKDGRFWMEPALFKGSIKDIAKEITKQEKEKLVYEKIGKHYQIYLEGWKIGHKQLETHYEQDGKEVKFVVGSQEESLACLEYHQEDPQRERILDWHFNKYLQHCLRLSVQFSDRRRSKPLYSVEPEEDDLHDIMAEEKEENAEPA